MLPEIFIDADACPVKQEVYRVARRYGLNVKLVANSPMRLPEEEGVSLVVVSGQQDAADDWIAEHSVRDDIVVTGDVPLAARCVKIGARVVEPHGRILNEGNIGSLLATRDLMTHLRDMGMETGGPAAFQKRDRSQFLQSLDKVIRAVIEGK